MGNRAYNAEHDVAHIAMDVTELDPPADQLTLSIQDGQLGFEWGQMAGQCVDHGPPVTASTDPGPWPSDGRSAGSCTPNFAPRANLRRSKIVGEIRVW